MTTTVLTMAFQGMTVVDSHVHLLPGRLGEKVRAFFDVGVSATTPLAYPNDHDAVLTTVHSEGVDSIWTLPYAHKPGVAAGLNAASAETVQRFVHSPVHVVGGCTVHPDDEDPLSIVRNAVDSLGLRVLKLHCSVGSFSIDDSRLRPVFSFASERRLPVVVHLGHNVNGRTEEDELPAIAKVADEYLEMPLILAHCGHHSAQQALNLMRDHPSLFADLTPVVHEFPDVDAQSLEEMSQRILFGSDAPNTAISVTSCLQWISDMNLTAETQESIVGVNAHRLTSAVISKQS
jgi:predicted TIM-barrel fold metal-dependent hydrolase